MNSASNNVLRRLRNAVVLAVVAVGATLAFSGTALAHQNDPCSLELTPKTADNPLGASHTVTAHVTKKGLYDPQTGHYDECYGSNVGTAGPLPGVTVHFSIVTGPNAGVSGDAVTDANGDATFTWVGNALGTDTIQASLSYDYCVDNQYTVAQCPAGKVQSETLADNATKVWYCPEGSTHPGCKPPPPPPPPPNCTTNPTLPQCVTNQVHPKVVIKVSKKCLKRKYTLRPSISGSAHVVKAYLYIDGHRYKTSHSGKKFTINTGRFSGKTHKIKLVTKFSDGTKITKKGKFKLCHGHVGSRRVHPRFTG